MSPAFSKRAAASLARSIIDQMVCSGPAVNRQGVPEGVMQTAVAVMQERPRDKGFRSLAVYAEMFAAKYFWEWYLAGWDYVAAEVRGAATRDAVAQHVFSDRDPRIAWRSPAGELVFDEIHPTHLAGAALDDWMQPRVAAGVRLGSELAGANFVGVRVLLPRAPRQSVLIRDAASLQLWDKTPYAQAGGLWR